MKTILTLLIVVAGLAAQTDTLKPVREVNGQTLISKSLPATKLTFASPLKYVGGQRFVLYGVAEAEQHFFVDADANGNIKRFYWVQFEHYLPSNSNSYDYKPVRTAKIGPLDFVHDSKMFTDYADSDWKKESDSYHMKAFLAEAGFKLPKEIVRIRMFHLPNKDNRSELMVIYVEALGAGALPADIKDETPIDELHPDAARGILGRVKASLTIEPL